MQDIIAQPQNISVQGIVTNIQQFTIHDGPGIRTEIFLKGCPLSCKWCSNPENHNSFQEVGVHALRCIGIDKCGYCLLACPECDNGVFFRSENTITGINRNICTSCLKCADACPANALVVWGKKRTVSDVMKIVLLDVDFYNKSGGGVTISGGEALLQWRFTLEIFKECKRHHIHTCLESSLHGNPSTLDKIYPYTDMVITDIKHMDDKTHQQYTGVGNGLIHGNIKKTVEMGVPLIIRVPIIPEYNNSEENIEKTAEFIIKELDNKVLQVQLLPYRQLGIEKYESLGLKYPMTHFNPPERIVWEKNIRYLVKKMTSYGIPAVAGANSKT